MYGGRSVEHFELEIGAGDSSRTPEYVTQWIAQDIYHEYNVYVEDYGIEIIDVTEDGVTVL